MIRPGYRGKHRRAGPYDHFASPLRTRFHWSYRPPPQGCCAAPPPERQNRPSSAPAAAGVQGDFTAPKQGASAVYQTGLNVFNIGREVLARARFHTLKEPQPPDCLAPFAPQARQSSAAGRAEYQRPHLKLAGLKFPGSEKHRPLGQGQISPAFPTGSPSARRAPVT